MFFVDSGTKRQIPSCPASSFVHQIYFARNHLFLSSLLILQLIRHTVGGPFIVGLTQGGDPLVSHGNVALSICFFVVMFSLSYLKNCR